MTKRDFQNDAWELTRQYGQPGDVAIVKRAMEFGYSLGIKDSTDELRKLGDKIKEEKERSNAPR